MFTVLSEHIQLANSLPQIFLIRFRSGFLFHVSYVKSSGNGHCTNHVQQLPRYKLSRTGKASISVRHPIQIWALDVQMQKWQVISPPRLLKQSFAKRHVTYCCLLIIGCKGSFHFSSPLHLLVISVTLLPKATFILGGSTCLNRQLF